MVQNQSQRIRTVVFWLGGTVLPPLVETMQRTTGAGNATALPSRQLRSLCTDLTWGDLSLQEFLERFPAAPAAIDAMPQVAPLPGMVDLLAELGACVSIRLVSDYPRAWVARMAAFSHESRLPGVDRMFYTAELDVPQESLGDRLRAAGVLEAGSALWVDRSVPRALALLRAGIDVSLCADAARLRRDLALWRLLPG